MQDPPLVGARVLAQGDTYVVQGAGRVAWAKISVPRGLDPARGAAAGEELGNFLVDQVLMPHSPWLGLVLDVRAGPTIIGPKSLRVMESLFDRAESVRRRLAILVGAAPILNQELLNLARSRAPIHALVTEAAPRALDWVRIS